MGFSTPPAFEILRNRNFRWLWTCTLGSVLASTMFMLARGYLAFKLTNSAAALGFIAMAQGAPMLFLSLIGGVVADRMRKKPLLIFVQTNIAIVGVATAILVQTGLVAVWNLAALSFMQGVLFSFTGPCRQALMIDLVGRENVAPAVALNNASTTTMSIIGPTAAGFLIAMPFLGVTYTMYLISAVYLVPVGALFFIDSDPPVVKKQVTGWLGDLGEGVRYMAGHPTLRLLFTGAIFAMIIGYPYQQLLPVFSEDVLKVGASGLGLMSGCIGIGAICGALGVANVSRPRTLAFLLVCAGTMFGSSLFVFGLMRLFPLVLVSLVFVGAAFSSFQTLTNTLAISSSAPAYYGRVSSVQQFGYSLSALAVLPLGVIVDAVGAPTVVMAMGLMLATVFLGLGLFSPLLRHVREASYAVENLIEPQPVSSLSR